MFTKNKKQIETKKGFSIGEVLLALFVLAFGITTSIYLMAGSMQDTMRSRDLLVASMLSQEGTELVRNMRDNNVTEKDSSDIRKDPFYGFPNGNDECSVDYYFNPDAGDNVASFMNNLKCNTSSYDLYLSEGDFGVMFYNHSGGDLTKFKRKIIIGFEDGKRSIASMVIWNREDFPSIEECFIGQNCTYSETILTAWIDIE